MLKCDIKYLFFLQIIWKYRIKDVTLQQIIKLRHSFLNGHGRPRTAFLFIQHHK